ncbi:hypothetical protein WOLCODRAFT_68845 [Wolfiporia cocos MD-104 SS10]|uniref:Uncharacterized protein n=1 Tax=Wolfiporia cocos (strain MD-104) TaxID=742152 RepID=A0A2H3JE88_WOLCO|nr:hypothetical protein WOLCODRAFT_68845 [Wolfiporia cocos MD-104 SS10]
MRWVPGSAAYEAGVAELAKRDYRRALDDLERLIVQCLFELTKLGISGIGYKLHEKIGKALKACAEAIKKALLRYNQCAAQLIPSRPALSWTDIMDMVSVADFDLLRDAREDIRMQPWTQRINRRAMNLYFNIKRAHEEVERLNVEIRRLLTFMYDEHADYFHAIAHLIITNLALAHELSLRWEYRSQVHEKIVGRIWQTSCLPGFTGNVLTEHRIGRDTSLNNGVPLPPWAKPVVSAHPVAEDEEVGEDGIPGLSNERDAYHFVNFLDDLGKE